MNRYDIGRRIESYRDRLNMSTQELAERINRSQATISRIENGKQGLTFELLSRIASELRVHPFALLSDEPLRFSVLLPPSTKKDGQYTPTLLSNALQSGRLKRSLRIGTAAEMLGVTESELEAIELAISCPNDDLLERMGRLYGSSYDELLLLKSFGREAPRVAKGLAYLQHIFSHVYHMAKNAEEGAERRILDKISELLESADTESPMQPDSSSDDIGLFLNRLSLHLVNALKDKEFYGKVIQLAGQKTGTENETVAKE